MWLSYRKNIDVEKNETGLVTISGRGVCGSGGSGAAGLLSSFPGRVLLEPGLRGPGHGIARRGRKGNSRVISAGAEIQPGEVYIKSKGGSAIYLRNDGTVLIKGNVVVDGSITEDGNENS